MGERSEMQAVCVPVNGVPDQWLPVLSGFDVVTKVRQCTAEASVVGVVGSAVCKTRL